VLAQRAAAQKETPVGNTTASEQAKLKRKGGVFQTSSEKREWKEIKI